jgi:uncharacterized protein
MSKRLADPRRLDVEAFADEGGNLNGAWTLSQLPRLAAVTCSSATPEAESLIQWTARGERRHTKPAPAQIWLHVSANVHLHLLCQRCLQPCAMRLDAQRSFMFVAGEQAAAELDETSEDDVLALTRALDLRDLVEDELLLSLPLVPKHVHCPQPLLAPTLEAGGSEHAPHPFAALATLKGNGPTR